MHQQQMKRSPLSVQVSYGDSLWTLARKYGNPKKDVREVVDEIILVNHIAPGELEAGMILIVPENCL